MNANPCPVCFIMLRKWYLYVKVATREHEIQPIVETRAPCWDDWCDGCSLMNDWKFLHFSRLFYHSYRDWETWHITSHQTYCVTSLLGRGGASLVILSGRKWFSTGPVIRPAISYRLYPPCRGPEITNLAVWQIVTEMVGLQVLDQQATVSSLSSLSPSFANKKWSLSLGSGWDFITDLCDTLDYSHCWWVVYGTPGGGKTLMSDIIHNTLN